MTAVDIERIRKCLEQRDLTTLFVDVLGWDAPVGSGRRVSLDGQVEAREVAVKKGVGVWYCPSLPSGELQRRLDAEVGRLTAERVLVFDDGFEQHWKWPEPRKSGAGVRLVTHKYFVGSRNDGLIQRLTAVRFTLAEHRALTVMDVRERVRMAFRADTVTAKFYKEFKAHHDAFVGTERQPGAIEGIPGLGDRTWYGSVLMNRLMFMYFLQKKGFMDGDCDYLRNRLKAVRGLLGRDAFYGFYRDFLLPVFHDGLGSHEHEYPSEEMARIIGDIPYVNGGLFEVHELEARYEIAVSDAAFESIFAFFDCYQWHLDDRPTSEPNEINPDVLGYIFEQYINQKQMGAYYTKEDVTGYMTESTVIALYLDRLDDEGCDPWSALVADPSRYIREPLGYGLDHDLPPEITGAQQRTDADDLAMLADEDHGLPGETWREVLARLSRRRRLTEDLYAGEVESAAQALVRNIDMRMLATDCILRIQDSERLLRAFEVLKDIAVLDPTCGSGAFLFAALDDLVDLYQAVIERDQELVEQGATPLAFAEEAKRHESPRYFILKAAMLNNLYGVDLMAEAAEIARLRLFLKLVAQLESKKQIEPLPDLDLNIKAGNLLVGIAHEADARERFGKDLLGNQEVDSIVAAAKRVGELYAEFVDAQEHHDDPAAVCDLKRNLTGELAKVRHEVDTRLHATHYASQPFEQWRASHSPLHWFVEFPRVMARGGFDAIAGNPPYIQRKDVTGYKFSGYQTDDCPDIFATCMERSSTLLRDRGTFAMIVPISLQFSEDYASARRYIGDRFDTLVLSTFSRNPAALFSAGLGVRSTILVGMNGQDAAVAGVWSTRLNRWLDEYRPYLFSLLEYARLSPALLGTASWPRTGTSRIQSLLEAFVETGAHLGDRTHRHGQHQLRFKSTALYYLSVFVNDPPAYTMQGRPTDQTKIGCLRFLDQPDRDFGLCVALGKLALLWWACTGDDFDVTAGGLQSTPIGREALSESAVAAILGLVPEIRSELGQHEIYTKYAGKMMGNYDVKFVRRLTDRVDAAILEDLGLSSFWLDIEHFYDGFNKQTGERPGTVRELPASFFPDGSRPPRRDA